MQCAGSASGLAKNFATLVEIMGSYGEVQIPQKGPLEEGRVSARTLAGHLLLLPVLLQEWKELSAYLLLRSCWPAGPACSSWGAPRVRCFAGRPAECRVCADIGASGSQHGLASWQRCALPSGSAVCFCGRSNEKLARI